VPAGEGHDPTWRDHRGGLPNASRLIAMRPARQVRSACPSRRSTLHGPQNSLYGCLRNSSRRPAVKLGSGTVVPLSSARPSRARGRWVH